jgi:hypothetical protein
MEQILRSSLEKYCVSGRKDSQVSTGENMHQKRRIEWYGAFDYALIGFDGDFQLPDLIQGEGLGVFLLQAEKLLHALKASESFQTEHMYRSLQNKFPVPLTREYKEYFDDFRRDVDRAFFAREGGLANDKTEILW